MENNYFIISIRFQCLLKVLKVFCICCLSQEPIVSGLQFVALKKKVAEKKAYID